MAIQCAKSISEFFLSSDEYKKAQIIFGYMAMDDEIDLSIILEKALKDGKKIALPRMERESNDMDFYYISSLEDSFTNDNKYKIQEPGLFCPKVELSSVNEKCIFLIPGLAFNLQGARLGRGKGYYDKYLSRLPDNKQILCGVCTVNVVTKAIPVDKNDVKLTHLLTEYGFVAAK